MGEESELIARCRRGEQEAFDRLYAAHSRPVAVYFLRSGFRTEQADDLTQETFVRAFGSISTFDGGRGSFRPWVSAIAKNVARRHWSRRDGGESFDPDLAEDVLAAPLDHTQSPEAREEVAAVRECVKSLPAELAKIVRMRYVDGRTTRSIGELGGIPEATVRLRLQQAQGLLEQCLKSKGFLA